MSGSQLTTARMDELLLREAEYFERCRFERQRQMRHMLQQCVDGVLIGFWFFITYRLLSWIWGMLT